MDWEVSKRAKRRAGAVRHRDGEPLAVSLTWEQFQERGWGAAAETIRHELLHVHLLNEHGDAGHGERFRTLAEQLQTGVRCERFADPNWWVVCEDCGSRLARYRRSKLVTDTASYRCGGCGGSFRVVDNRDAH
nr:SprT-like domain-containing protein [Halomarina rubra]